jgi:integrase/recombinase XerC/integrase/recombinase XerD
MHAITVDQAKTMFLKSLEHPRRKNTFQTYRKALETFLNMLVIQQIDPFTFPVSKLREDSILQFVDYMKDLSPATEILYLQVLKSFFEFLDAENLAKINITQVRIRIKQRTRRSKREPIQYPELSVKGLLEFMSDPKNLPSPDDCETNYPDLRNRRDRALILTLADTGLRVEEICRLRCVDIDWERNRAILNGQGNKQAVVRFSTRALNATRDYLVLREPLDLKSSQIPSSLPLFARHDKGAGQKIKPITPTTIRRIVTERVNQILGAEAAATITPHTFMHYFVTTILRATGNLKLAQVLARHSNIQVTQSYAHINDSEIDKGYYEIFEKRESPDE